MSCYELRYLGDPVLEAPCVLVRAVEDIPFGLVLAMRDVMKKWRGVGLSAPQVGSLLQVALIQVNSALVVAINPRIESASKETKTEKEGCLSIPNFFTPVPRARKVRVWYQDERLLPVSRALVGFEARIAQHEIDHLHGKTIVTGAEGRIRKQAEREVARALANLNRTSA